MNELVLEIEEKVNNKMDMDIKEVLDEKLCYCEKRDKIMDILERYEKVMGNIMELNDYIEN